MPITRDADWWRNAVIYQVYPKSWADGDGDGVGDVTGIRAHLSHLARLGIDAVWFSPWYPSPQADGGYDVSDYRDIDPVLGTVAQVEALIAEAHDLGIKVIVDVVPNHTSDEHPFFREALASEPGSPAWRRYHLRRGAAGGTEPPNNWRSTFGGSAWDQVADTQGNPSGWWYLHLFDSRQPDLNWDDPSVREDFLQTLRFWFDRGVDGFRIDVAHGLVKDPQFRPAEHPPVDGEDAIPRPAPSPHWDQPGVHEIWREWRRVANEYTPPRAFVGEVWVPTVEGHAAYLRPDELHTAFNFHYLKCPWDPIELRAVVDLSLREAASVGASTTWVLENHDVPRLPTRLGPHRARAAELFMLGLPGSAYLYQGQELGLPEVLDLPDEVRQDPAFARTAGQHGMRDGCRVPIPWTRDGTSFGFSPTGRSWLPQPADWGALSVQAQAGDPTSMLEMTRAALRLRRAEQALGDGDMEWISRPGDTCVVLRRPAGDADPHVLVAVNLGSEPALVVADEVLITSGAALEPVDEGFLLPPDTAAWLR